MHQMSNSGTFYEAKKKERERTEREIQVSSILQPLILQCKLMALSLFGIFNYSVWTLCQLVSSCSLGLAVILLLSQDINITC